MQSSLPVTAAQRSVYFGHQLDPVGHLYNTGVYIESFGAVDVEQLALACRRVLDQAQTLHVNFVVDEAGELAQIPRRTRQWDLPVVDFTGASEPEEASARRMRQRMEERVDLATDLLFHFEIHLIADEKIRIYQQYHHIVNDGYGMSLVMTRIAKAYSSGTTPDLAAEWSLERFVEADRQYVGSEQYDADRDYWLGELADFPDTARLIDVERAPAPGVTHATLDIDVTTRARLEAAAKKHGLQLSRLLIALLGAYVSRVSGREDVVLSLPTTARGTRELRSTPGMVASVLPLRITVGDDSTIADIAAEADRKVWLLLKHGRFRGEDLGRELAASNPTWRPPGVGLNIMPNSLAHNLLGRESTGHIVSSGPVGDIEFIMLLRKSGWPIEIGVRSHPDNAEPCRDYAEGLGDFVDAFLADDGAPVRSLRAFGWAPPSDVPHDAGTSGPVALTPALSQLRDVRSAGVLAGAEPRVARFAGAAGLDRSVVEAALRSLTDHHHALRTMITAPAPILWMASIADPAQFSISDLVVESACAAGTSAADLLAHESATPDVRAGRPLVAVMSAGGGAGEVVILGDRDLIDEKSWDIVTADFENALRARLRGRTPVLPPVPTALSTYAQYFTETAAQPATLGELPHWTSVLAPGADLPVSASGQGAAQHVEELTKHVVASADAAAARLVKGDATDVWAAALAIAADTTKDDPDQPRSGELLVDVWHDGRDALAGSDHPVGPLDLDRTVGPLDWTAPVRLVLTDDPLSALRAAKERRRAAPSGGIGWPMLRYANVQSSPALAAAARPQVLLRTGGDAVGSYLLDVRIEALPDGTARVHLRSDHGLDRSSLSDFGRRWRAAVETIVALGETGGSASTLTPSDLDHLELSQSAIDRIAAVSPAAVEDIWPLSPLQRGLFFQAAFDEAQDIYTAQFSLDFGHRLDAVALRRAASWMLESNPTLRAGFTNDGLDEPVQFIGSGLEVPFTEVDLSDLEPHERERRAQELMRRDRALPFDLERPPLWRVLLLHLGDIDRLVVNREFILWDGWSGALFVEQFLDRYRSARSGGTVDDFSSAEAGFTDYLSWLAERDPAAAADSWRCNLEGFEQPTLLAGSVRDRAPVVPQRIESYVAEDLVTSLREQARRSGVTLNALMNAVMGLLLAAESGRTDVVFGSTVAGRPTEIVGLDRVIGMFLNTVPVRVSLDPRETVRELLRRMQDEYVARMEFEYLGLGDIQQASGHDQLFDTLFVLQNFKNQAEMAEQSARHDIVAEDSLDHTHYPLAIVVSPGARLHVKIDYRPDVVDADRAHALHDRFLRLLALVAQDADRVVASLPSRTEAEEAASTTVRQSTTETVEDATIAEMLIERADSIPDEIALVFGAERRTYGELRDGVESLARRLVAAGAGPEVVVALGLPRSIDTVVALFAVLRTGAAYLPLELDQPTERLRTVLADAVPALHVTTEEVAQRLSLDADRCVMPGADSAHSTEAASSSVSFGPGTPGRLDHPAYVIYTSGSTGKPKGVITPYRGLTNMQRNHRSEIFDVVVSGCGGRRIRVAHTVSFAFDMSWEELLWLVEGHEVHICDEDLRRDSAALVAYCDENRIDVVNVTPTYATQLFADGLLDGESDRPGAHRPPLVLLGGEAVPDSVWNRLREKDGVLGYNLYGPTEYTINTLGAGTDESATPTVGTPIRSTRAHILDPWLRPVVDGVAGELYIAGVGLARGYLGRFGGTAERFVADPFAPGRMYRTGDFVRRRPDGNIDYLGRIDDQVKIRGHRVELHEIESAVEAVPGVASAAVVAVDDALVPGAKRLAAYLVEKNGADGRGSTASGDLVEAVAAHLRAQLPDYMVPGHFTVIDAIPMTVNGKLDVRALPAPEVRTGKASRPPRTDTERALCAVFAELLGVEEVGVEDDFFDLGGHSMVAMRVIGRIRTDLGVQVTIRDLFDARTPELLARVLGSSAKSAAAIVAGLRPAIVPLSAAQERLWMVYELEADSLAYHYAHVARLDGAVDASALADAVRDVARRHETLRTVIGIHEGRPFQLVKPPSDATVLEVVDATVLEVVDATEDQVGAMVTERLTAPFDLRADVPFRVSLVRTAPDQFVLAVSLHHIATDAWSDGALFGDLTRAYFARLEGREPDWEPLAVQYADYTLWQNRLLAEGAVDEQITYWRETLAGAPEELALPVDRGRPVHPTGAAATIQRAIPAETVDRLRAVADDRRGTVFMALHAVTAAVLSRFGAGEDIALGTPVSGRVDSALEDLVGFFVNTVVLRADVSGDPEFGDLVERLRDTDLGAMAHQDVPFQRVVEELAPGRREGRNPLFHVMISYLQRTGALPDFLGVRTQWEQLSNVRAKFDLNFTYVDVPETGEIAAAVEYATELFDRSTVERLLDAVVSFAVKVGSDPSLRVGAVALTDDAEESRLLSLSEGERVVFDSVPIGDALTAAAVRSGDAPALETREETITYAQLEERSNRLARYLARSGVGPGSTVAVAVPRSIELVVALHAVVKSGAAYLPLDTELPAARIAYMVENAKPAFALSTSAVTIPGELARVDLDDPEVVAHTGGLASTPLESGERSAPLTVDAPVYVIYTSGSTGEPKGVVVSHAAVSNRLSWIQQISPIGAGDRMILKTPTTFDVSVWELFWPSLAGACTVIAEPQAHRDPSEIARMLSEFSITNAHFVPSMLDEVLAVPSIRRCTSLAHVVCSGEALPRRTIARFAQVFPDAHLDNLYGPTEAAVEVSRAADLTRDVASYSGAVSDIGGPGFNTDLYVLDSRLRAAPIGVPGELYIGGVQLAHGYLGRPELTAERFCADPFGVGERLYRTGDLVRWTRRGSIEYLGRIDEQVKIRGLRIELGEVEAAIESLPFVARAVASVRTVAAEPVLVAWFVPVGDATPTTAELRSALTGALPTYMIPTVFAAITEVPLGFNGKLDRRALRVPDLGARSHSRTPRTELERNLVSVVVEVLGIDTEERPVGIDDDFFALGGHSLSAVRLANAVQSELGYSITLRDVFDSPTVAGLASLCGTAVASVRPELVRRPVPERLPLSFAQRRMWILDQLGARGGVYNVPISWRVTGGVDSDVLRRAVRDLVLRHESLRTVFPALAGEPYQSIVVPGDLEVHVDVARTTPENLRESLAAAAHHEFDLERDIPIRVWQFDLPGGDSVVMLVIHHIATDEWSTRALLGDLATAYALRRTGRTPNWQVLPVQYSDYTLWQREMLGDPGRPDSLAFRQREYWRGALSGAPEELVLPADRRRPAQPSYRGGNVHFAVDEDVVSGLRDLARSHNASMFMIAQTAVAILLQKFGAGEDIPLGTPVSGRVDSQLEDLVGFFLNTVVLRTDVSGDPTIGDLIGRVRTTALEAFENQDLPFEQVVDAVRGSSMSVHPLFQVMVVYLTEPAPDAAFGSIGGPSTPEPLDTGTAKFDLSFDFLEYAGTNSVVGVVEYSSDLFDESTAARLVSGLGEVLRVMASAERDRRVSAVGVLDPEERARVLVEWNAQRPKSASTRGSAVTVVDLLADAVRTHPARLALVDGDRAWTFSELSEEVGRLARLLVCRGVEPEVPVALVLPRSGHTLISMFAVMTAGGAYIACDPSSPPERIATILDTTGAALVLTTAELVGRVRTATPLLIVDDRSTIDELALQSPAPLTDADRRGVLRPENPAYVVHTSGSTGTPKAVTALHRGLVALFHSHRQDLYRPTARRAERDHLHVGHAWSFSFDASWQPQLWMLDGHTVFLADERAQRDPQLLVSQAREQTWDFLEVTPSHLGQLLDNGLVEPGRHRPVSLGFGGEAVSQPLWERLREIPGIEGYNLYGPSESTVDALVGRTSTGGVPVAGTAVDGTRAYVLDAWLQPVPVGTDGELYLAGDGVVRGYLDDPRRTAERFVPDVHGEPGDRMYRTGDRVHWSTDGQIRYRGRADDQIKIRGYRVEPAEIESSLVVDPRVSAALVVARDDVGATRRLVAYVVAEDGRQVDVASLPTMLRASLPDYMIPSAFVVLDRLPTLPNGKIDRSRLPRPETEVVAPYRPPITATEELLCEVFSDLLGVERVGVDDDVFDLGCDSLGVMQVMSRLRASGRSVDAGRILGARTVGNLAADVDLTAPSARGVDA